MGYTINFYALDASAFARQLRDSAEGLLDRVQGQINHRAGATDEARRLVMQSAAAICRGDVPEDCGIEYFYSLGWLVEVASERITICPFQDFRRYSFLEETGIWPLLLRSKPPFSVPTYSDPPPAVGYLGVEDMEALGVSAMEQLAPSHSRDVTNARDEFLDVLETLVRDRLDLLALLV